MQDANLLQHTYFFREADEEMTVVTVEPDLARMVIGSRLMPAQYKRDYLRSTDKSASYLVMQYALESELFFDVMLQLGIMSVHDAVNEPQARRRVADQGPITSE
jgi:hypothetical protein